MTSAACCVSHWQNPLRPPFSFCLVAFGCPLSWKKTAIGSSNTWLGFIVAPSQQLVRTAPAKHELVRWHEKSLLGLTTNLLALQPSRRRPLPNGWLASQRPCARRRCIGHACCGVIGSAVCSYSNPSDVPSRGKVKETCRDLGLVEYPEVALDTSIISYQPQLMDDPYMIVPFPTGDNI